MSQVAVHDNLPVEIANGKVLHSTHTLSGCLRGAKKKTKMWKSTE